MSAHGVVVHGLAVGAPAAGTDPHSQLVEELDVRTVCVDEAHVLVVGEEPNHFGFIDAVAHRMHQRDGHSRPSEFFCQ